MSFVLDLCKRKTTFRGGIASTWSSPTGLVELSSDQPVAIEVLEVYLAQDGIEAAGLTANEHFGLRFVGLEDNDTPGALTLGSSNAVDDRTELERRHITSLSGPQAFSVVPTESVNHLVNDAQTTATSLSEYERFDDGWNCQVPYKQIWLPGNGPKACLGLNDVFGAGPFLNAFAWQFHGVPSADLSVRGYMVYLATLLTLD